MTEVPTVPSPGPIATGEDQPLHPDVVAAAQDQQDLYEDYWGSDETFKYMLPDNKQYFEIKPMDEGAKARFQKKTNKGIRVSQRSDDAHLDVDPAGERWQLIKDSVISWHIMQRDPKSENGWSPYPCPPKENGGRFNTSLENLLERFNPKVIQDLEFFIRTKNPWMQADMSIEEIDKEIDRLGELRKQAVEQQAGE